MIDWYQPIETEDGLTVTVLEVHRDSSMARCTYKGTIKKNGIKRMPAAGYWYGQADGEFVGGTEFHYRIQNVARPEMYIPEDWS